ncbi:MAG: hypothetical protein EOM12_05685 [Verrucomicrobiae bacterium]|nr:hypothetical protein [Verrucomicrobiae bacterium]
MDTLTIKMPEQLSYRLRRAAKERGENCSVLVRQAVENMLEANNRSESPSILDLAGDLAGKLNSEADLSVNPRHMSGFGE